MKTVGRMGRLDACSSSVRDVMRALRTPTWRGRASCPSSRWREASPGLASFLPPSRLRAPRLPALRRPAATLTVLLICGLISGACVVDAPILYRADAPSGYASKYFRVEAPSGPGWEAVVRTAAHPFRVERALFSRWVPPRIGFTRHDWRELWPHSMGPEPVVEFGACPAHEGEQPGPSSALSVPIGERALGGVHWHVFEDVRSDRPRTAELVAIDEGITFRVRLRVAPHEREIPPPALAHVVAGFRRERVTATAEERAIERGVAALYDAASAGDWMGESPSEAQALAAQEGIARLTSMQPDRPEAPLLAAGLALLRGRSEFLGRSATHLEPVGPFEIAFEDPSGRIATAALVADYDTEAVVRAARASLAIAPGGFWARYHLGLAFARGGDLRAGAGELSRLADRYPDEALAWFALALVQRAAGDPSAARDSVERAATANARQEVFSMSGTGLFGSTLIERLARQLDSDGAGSGIVRRPRPLSQGDEPRPSSVVRPEVGDVGPGARRVRADA